MITERIDIKVRTSGASDFQPYLKCFIPDTHEELRSFHKRKSLIICPGGGYAMRSFREDEPLVFPYLAAGVAAFVLEYSVGSDFYGNKPARFPQQLCEACEAIATVRKNAEKWDLDPNEIYIMGFSAGGHLAASATTMYKCKEVLENLGGKPDEYRPDGAILAYPVISYNGIPTHVDSFKNLLGDKFNDEDAVKYVSTEAHIDKDTPRCFIWATSNDQAVPVINSLIFATKLSENNVPFELEIFEDGPHGLSLCNGIVDSDRPSYAHWVNDSIKWMNKSK